MKAAVVRAPGQSPAYLDFEDPSPQEGEYLVDVSAAALTPLTRSRASGTHYSSEGAFPFVAGVDGVGHLADGRRVYFLMPRAPFGAMTDRTVVARSHCVNLPDGIDDVTAAVIANPGMSSWVALTDRARIVPGETVLVNGATGAAGGLAIRIARHLGAAKVIATGRAVPPAGIVGADETVSLDQHGDALRDQFRRVFLENGVNIVLDYLWGQSAGDLLGAAAGALAAGARLRFVQIGSIAGETIALPGSVLRSAGIELMGSGFGSASFDQLMAGVSGVFGAAHAAGLELPSSTVNLADVGRAWDRTDGERRTVFVDGTSPALRGGTES